MRHFKKWENVTKEVQSDSTQIFFSSVAFSTFLPPLPWSLVYLVYCKGPPAPQQHYLAHSKSCPTLCTPWTVAHQAPLSMGFSRQEHWSGLPFPFPGDLPDPGTEPVSFMCCTGVSCLPLCLPLPLDAPRTGMSPIFFFLQWALHTCAQIGPFLSHLSLQASTLQLLSYLSVSPGHQVLVNYTAVLHSSSQV